MSIDGLTTIPSKLGPKETMDDLEAEVRAMGMRVFARIDHTAGAAAAGLSLRPTEVLIFGNAKAGRADEAMLLGSSMNGVVAGWVLCAVVRGQSHPNVVTTAVPGLAARETGRANLGGRGIALIAPAATALWGFSGVFRVEPDELGVERCSSPQHGPLHQPTMPTTEVAICSK
jgi:hypothetical protein